MTHTDIPTRAQRDAGRFDPLVALDDLLADVGLAAAEAALSGRVDLAVRP
jgi:hypothetical protein